MLDNIEKSRAANKASNFKNGYKPPVEERTLEGFMNKNVSKEAEVKLYTRSTGFNNVRHKDMGTKQYIEEGGQFKRFGTDLHAGLAPHVHYPIRNVIPGTGKVRGAQGKTLNVDVFSPSKKDIKQLYDYLFNNKYQPPTP